MPRTRNIDLPDAQPIRAVASPVDAFTPVALNQGSAQSLGRLAHVLDRFGGQFSRFHQTVAGEQFKEEEERLRTQAELDVQDADTEKAFDDLVKQGLIPAEGSPFFMRLRAEAFARRVARDAYGSGLLEEIELHNSNPENEPIVTSEQLSAFIQTHRAGFIDRLPEDARVRGQFLAVADRYENQAIETLAKQRREKLREEVEFLVESELGTVLDEIAKTSNILTTSGGAVEINPTLVSQFQNIIEEYARRGHSPQRANELARQAIANMALIHSDPDFLDLAKHIKTGPGGRHSLADSTITKTMFASVREKIESDEWTKEHREWQREARVEEKARKEGLRVVTELFNKHGSMSFLDLNSTQQFKDIAPEVRNDPIFQRSVLAAVASIRSEVQQAKGVEKEAILQKWLGQKISDGEISIGELKSAVPFLLSMGFSLSEISSMMDNAQNINRLRKQTDPRILNVATEKVFEGSADAAEFIITANLAGDIEDQQAGFLLTKLHDINTRGGTNQLVRSDVVRRSVSSHLAAIEASYNSIPVEERIGIDLTEVANQQSIIQKKLYEFVEQQIEAGVTDEQEIVRGLNEYGEQLFKSVRNLITGRPIQSPGEFLKDFNSILEGKKAAIESTVSKLVDPTQGPSLLTQQDMVDSVVGNLSNEAAKDLVRRALTPVIEDGGGIATLTSLAKMDKEGINIFGKGFGTFEGSSIVELHIPQRAGQAANDIAEYFHDIVESGNLHKTNPERLWSDPELQKLMARANHELGVLRDFMKSASFKHAVSFVEGTTKGRIAQPQGRGGFPTIVVQEDGDNSDGSLGSHLRASAGQARGIVPGVSQLDAFRLQSEGAPLPFDQSEHPTAASLARQVFMARNAEKLLSRMFTPPRDQVLRIPVKVAEVNPIWETTYFLSKADMKINGEEVTKVLIESGVLKEEDAARWVRTQEQLVRSYRDPVIQQETTSRSK